MSKQELKEGRIRIPSGCAISAAISREGRPISGQAMIESMRPMRERSNGLGGGFAGYGIYPEYKDFFALHIFYDSDEARTAVETHLRAVAEIVRAENIPTRKIPSITGEPLIWRYFAAPLRSVLQSRQQDEDEFIARLVMYINTNHPGAYVFSSGKNMGVFKAVGYPEDVGEFYRLEEYKGYCWTAHGRYPTNTPAGGAGRTPLRCWTGPSCITGRSPPTTAIGAILRCTATAAPCRRTRRSSPILPTFCSASRG